VDGELESRLVDLARTRDRTVFDSWALAWICPAPIVRIWIESDAPSRARTGEGGLLGRLTKMVVEGALEGELDDTTGRRAI
jgi:hypothetical protein